MEKVVQAAGRERLGGFAPEFAHFNDDVSFGENWNNGVIDHKTRCVNIPAGVKHWRRAAPDSWFSYLAIEVGGVDGSNEWLEPVSDEQYGSLE